MDASASAARALEEPTEATGIFGTVTNKRVFFWRSRSWFGGQCWEELTLAQITSVAVEVHRHRIGGILLGLCGAATLAVIHPVIVVQGVGWLLIGVGALLVWGSPVVHIEIAGQRHVARGSPWRRKEARAFVAAIRQQLVDRQAQPPGGPAPLPPAHTGRQSAIRPRP
jgi:hypothetical protein